MRIIIDTNIVLDVLIHRAPFFEESSFKYLRDKNATLDLIKNHLFGSVNIAAVDSDIIMEALNIEWDDFEDCVQYVTGKSIIVDYIITRNIKDFSKATIKVITPKEFLDIIAPE